MNDLQKFRGIQGRQFSSNGIYWTQCREIFHNHHFNSNQDCIFFATTKIDRVIRFIKFIEKKLNLKKYQKIVFVRFYNVKNILKLENLSKFWSKNNIRRQFLTTALRCGILCENRNYMSRMKSHFGSTYLAAKKFLAGYTRMRNNGNGGWYINFRHSYSYYNYKGRYSEPSSNLGRLIK